MGKHAFPIHKAERPGGLEVDGENMLPIRNERAILNALGIACAEKQPERTSKMGGEKGWIEQKEQNE